MEVAIPITNELEQRISDAFCIFDHHGDKRIDIREVGTVLRFLGCVPTEQEINEVIAATEMEESAGDVHLSKFMPHVAQLLAERKMEPASPEKILAAFQILDPEQKTYITKEYMSKMMMEEGEPFTQEELDEMLAVAIDPITGNIPYEFYINQLMVRSICIRTKFFTQFALNFFTQYLHSNLYSMHYVFALLAKLKHEPANSIYELATRYWTLKPKEIKRGSKWAGSRISIR